MVGKPQQSVTRFIVNITTVDPTQQIIRGVMKGDTQERGISVVDVSHAFRWPQVGEAWMVEQKNGIWFLEGYMPSPSQRSTIRNIPAGDLVLTSTTGTVHVVGSPDGVSDFILTPPVKHAPALTFHGNLSAVRTHAGVSITRNMVTL